jgi:hypothetical protein
MIYHPEKKELIIDKNINELDKFVIDFVRTLKNYVIVSGYVSIITGRSRATEDVDLLVPKMSLIEFRNIWNIVLDQGFECLNTTKVDEAYKFLEEHAIRFARKDKPIPNMEFKIMKNDIDKYSFDNKITVKIKNHKLFISPFEMQIAFKLFLGSQKDIEDAKHIYILFEQNINKDELAKLCMQLKVSKKLDELIWK